MTTATHHTAESLIPRLSWLFTERAMVRRAIARWCAADASRALARRLIDAELERDLCRVLLDDIEHHLVAMGVSAARIVSTRQRLRSKGRRELEAVATSAREMATDGWRVGAT